MIISVYLTEDSNENRDAVIHTENPAMLGLLQEMLEQDMIYDFTIQV